MKASMLLIPLLLLGLPAAADEPPDVDRIVEQTNRVAYYQGDDGRARVKMSTRDAKGLERVKAFTFLRRD